MTRRGNKRDANHAEIREALRTMGAYVIDAANDAGAGFDLLAYHRGVTYTIEVKNGSALTSNERAVRAAINACGVPYWIISTVDDAARMLNGELAPF